MRSIVLCSAIVSLITLATPAAAGPKKPARAAEKAAAGKGPEKVTSVEGITEYRLDNGLHVLLFPDPSKPTITVNVTYLVGSRHENYGETGMAHLLEHLVFKGTPKHPDVTKVLNSLGARFNGSTWYDRTNYFISFPASDANLDKALELEADRMVNSNIARKDLDSEMTVVRNEFESGENNPWRVTQQRVVATAFEWHNYGKSTIGCRADIENVNIERLQAFYRTYYQPDNAYVIVAGKIDEQKTLRRIGETFGVLPRPKRALQRTYTLDPVQDGERAVTVRRVGDTQHVMALYKVPAGSDPDAAALDVLGQVMADEPAGRLYKSLVETKKAASVFPWLMQTREPGFMLFSAELPKAANLDDARETMLKALESPSAFSADEVERAKQSISKQMELTLQTSDRLGITLSEYLAQGDWRLFFLHRDRVAQVKPADVQRAATAYLRSANRTIGQFVPTAKPMRAEIPAIKDVAKMVDGYKGRAQIARGEDFDAEPMAIDRRIQRLVLPSGLKVALLPKKTRGEGVSFQLRTQLGDEKSLQGKQTIGSLTGSMLMRGSDKHTRQQIKDELDKRKTELGVFGGAEGVSAMATTTREHLVPVLRLLAEILRRPAFPDKELQLLIQEETTNIESQRSEPSFLAQNALQRHMSPYPKGHVRYVATPDEDLADLRSIKRSQVEAFHKDFHGVSSGELAIVGDFDAQEVERVLRELFGDWKAKTAFVRIPQKNFNVPAIAKRIEAPDKANAMLFAGVTLDGKDTDPDYPAMLIANYALGGGALKSRLADRIRQKEGLSYGVGSFFFLHALDRFGTWGAYAIFAPQNAGKVEAALREEVAKALSGGFSKEELEHARSSWLQGQAVSRAQDRELAGRIAGQLYLDRTMAHDAQLESKVRELQAAALQAALKRYLDPAKLNVVVAGDFAKAPAAGAPAAAPAPAKK